MARTAAQKRKQKPDSAYYIKMSDAVPPVVRRSASCAVDATGALVKTNRNVQNVGAGQIKKIESGEQLIDLFLAFTDHIRENNYSEYPTKLNFCRWLGIGYSTLFEYLSDDYQNKDRIYKAILADVLNEGMATGAYKHQGTIFALKNWCGWADRVETTTKQGAEKVDKETADRLIKEYVNGLQDSKPIE